MGRLAFPRREPPTALLGIPSPRRREMPPIQSPRRAYLTDTFRRRLHQVAFRERVLRAYAERCALCRLRHQELLDAAHITPDSDAEGEPVIGNGVALCKLHHAAFDRFTFAIRPDLRHRGAPGRPRRVGRPDARRGAPADPRPADPSAPSPHRPPRPCPPREPLRAVPPGGGVEAARRFVWRRKPPMIAGRDDGAQDQCPEVSPRTRPSFLAS